MGGKPPWPPPPAPPEDEAEEALKRGEASGVVLPMELPPPQDWSRLLLEGWGIETLSPPPPLWLPLPGPSGSEVEEAGEGCC